MADTLQAVSWLLEQSCPFRQGAAATSFDPAFEATWRLQAIDEALRKNNIYDGVCVVGTTYFRGEEWPSRGFRISEVLAPAGNEESARQICRECPANSRFPAHGEMAGCTGFFYLQPDDPDLERALRAAIASKGLTSEFAQAFLPTTPLWYGLWARSPLQPRQLHLLTEILRYAPRSSGTLADTSAFQSACQIAIDRAITLQVSLAPPGHTEFGYHDIYEHCPCCKRVAQHRAFRRAAKKQAVCPTCTFSYNPAETASTKSMPTNDSLSLEQILSGEDFRALRYKWQTRNT